ncbi:hypothetical protein FBX98_1422 [Burkholderia sp. SJZ115]|nr:hypothetical protein FB600_1422 [Burkholderia sp. SJZ089]TWC92477.1 hypothetical protein FBX98_1422 [Burkholderia sp. SJZ115]TWC95481.1 hypothetical protein FB601_1422 [Burkholderia sp. SJZ091]
MKVWITIALTCLVASWGWRDAAPQSFDAWGGILTLCGSLGGAVIAVWLAAGQVGKLERQK